MKSFLLSIWEIVEVGLIAVITVVAVRHFLVQPFVVSGRSMEPNFAHGDYLLTDEISYRYRTPQRGEVVVFRSPTDNKSFFIKRIIGLPNEKIVINDNKITIFNEESPEGIVLDEPYTNLVFSSAPVNIGNLEISLKNEEYFVLGDNRLESFDSRAWGPLQKSAIVGLVRLRLWPISKVKAIEIPAY
ncbi:signal peptidase I [Candidatus Wolfebacteria bacterium CG03_land_8_20_14_0_80_36_15]|uniref:Signal peptidase I n=1 Tax=Candidatus Wolfebacteria bacterium CG03_land_8_20_14_0_80_36_15 TaxID=1975067 RepID=A0A2M7B828_9BACT|nr:MAG: signal peptidase I [Candidatus Wolfebacteria bacterium CG03_land_8_20_14_0_80_36_15]